MLGKLALAIVMVGATVPADKSCHMGAPAGEPATVSPYAGTVYGWHTVVRKDGTRLYEVRVRNNGSVHAQGVWYKMSGEIGYESCAHNGALFPNCDPHAIMPPQGHN